MLTASTVALIVACTAVLSFVLGGGTVGRYLARGYRANLADGLKEDFFTRKEGEALQKETARDVRDVREELRETRDLLLTVQTLASAVAEHKAEHREGMASLRREVDHLRDEVKEMRRPPKQLPP